MTQTIPNQKYQVATGQLETNSNVSAHSISQPQPTRKTIGSNIHHPDLDMLIEMAKNPLPDPKVVVEYLEACAEQEKRKLLSDVARLIRAAYLRGKL